MFTIREVFICILILIQKFYAQETDTNEYNGICYEGVGCFSQNSPWVTFLRPFPIPKSPEEINITIYIVTRRNDNLIPLSPLLVTSQELYSLDYNPFRPITAFIIHGFTASIQSAWMMDLAHAYLSKVDANIFLVDWGNGAKNANYLQVAANTRVVGAIMSRFLSNLVHFYNQNPFKVHIIGHSLGAHVAGYMGQNVSGIYRITALDAAQIGFEGTDPSVRLSQDDAENIDAYHTNGKPTVPTFGLGFISEIGDIDFYINGGIHQPSCAAVSNIVPDTFPTLMDIAQLPVEALTGIISCSHSKSIEYFIEAVERTDCIMWGRKRGLIRSVLNVVTFGQLQPILGNVMNQCTLDTCSPMGLECFLFPARGKFFVSTNIKPKYCIEDPDTTTRMMESYYGG